MTTATTDLTAKVIELAKKSAADFVGEFNEPIDPATTDWDGVAWGEHDRIELKLTDDEADHFWPIWQAALVAETERLCAQAL